MAPQQPRVIDLSLLGILTLTTLSTTFNVYVWRNQQDPNLSAMARANFSITIGLLFCLFSKRIFSVAVCLFFTGLATLYCFSKINFAPPTCPSSKLTDLTGVVGIFIGLYDFYRRYTKNNQRE